MVKSAAKSKKSVSRNSSTKVKNVGRISSSKVDELKLGKFDECVPMRLPESQVRRSWQVIGGIALLLIAAYCVFMMVTNTPFAYLAWGGVDLWREEQWPLTIAWIVNNVCLVVFTILCLVTSILMFAKKRIAVGVWYAMIVLLVVGFISQSIGIYENYTTRECVTQTCPMVVGELSVVLLCNLVIMMVAILLLWLVCCMNKHRHRSVKRVQRRR